MPCSNTSDSGADVYDDDEDDASSDTETNNLLEQGDLCSDEEHFYIKVVDNVPLRMNTDDVFRCVFERNSSVFNSWMMERQASDVQVTEWSPNPDDDDTKVSIRELSYSLAHPRLSFIKVTEKQTMRKHSSHYFIDSESTITGFEYCDIFRGITRYYITCIARTQCRFMVTSEVKFVETIPWDVRLGAGEVIETHFLEESAMTFNVLVQILERESANYNNLSATNNVKGPATTLPPASLTGCNIPSDEHNYDECVEIGKLLRSKIELWVELRMKTAEQLRLIASNLEKVRTSVCLARVTGSSVAVVGGIASIFGTIMSFATAGLGVPIAVAVVGGISSIGGAATSGISQLVEKVMSSKEMEKAKIDIEADSKASEEILNVMTKLADASQSLNMTGFSDEERVNFFLFHEEFVKSGLVSQTLDLSNMKVPEDIFQVTSVVLSITGKTAFAVGSSLRIADLIKVATEAATEGAMAAGVGASAATAGAAAAGVGTKAATAGTKVATVGARAANAGAKAAGAGAKAAGAGARAVGSGARAANAGAKAAGAGARAVGSGARAAGAGAKAAGAGARAVGSGARAAGAGAKAVGAGARAAGTGARAANTGARAAGVGARAANTGARAAGAGAKAANAGAKAATAGTRAGGAVAAETIGMAAEAVSGTGTVVRAGMSTGAKVAAGIGLLAGGIGLAFDIADIVMASIALAKEGKTDDSESLLNTAITLEKNAKTVKGLLEQAVDWLEETAPVKAHLDRFRGSDVSAGTELSATEMFILDHICEQQPVDGTDRRLLLNIVKLFYDSINVKLKRLKSSNYDEPQGIDEDGSKINKGFEDSDSDPTKSEGCDEPSKEYQHVDILLLARTSIPGGDSWEWETGSALVDHPGINDVVLYPPWNCAMDVTAAHAICCGALTPSSRCFEHCSHSSRNGQPKLNCTQTTWNCMTKAKQTCIPRVAVAPLPMSNDELFALHSACFPYDGLSDEGDTLRLVVPYAIDAADGQLYRSSSLSIVCQAVGAVCHMLSLTATVHMLSDLTIADRHQSHVPEIKQYCYVMNEGSGGRPRMTCRWTDLTEFRKTLDKFLNE